ncbi:hypothetical protein ACO0QE_003139 [Hanseniaspora vineae]
MTAPSVQEKNELALIDKVELRLALANDAAKYTQFLETFLCPLLLKLASPHSTVRAAIFNLIKDITSRLNSYPEIKLPVLKLIKQAKNPNVQSTQDSQSVRLYSLLLASKGVTNLQIECQDEILLECCDGISDLPPTIAARMFLVFLKLVAKWSGPKLGTLEETSTKSFYSFSAKDTAFLSSKFIKFFLLIPAKPVASGQPIPRGYVCPGLSLQDVAFFTFDAGVTYTKDQLKTSRKSLFRFITHGINFDDIELVKNLSVISVDSSNNAEQAQTLLKRMQIPYENESFIGFLIELYTGNKQTGTPPVPNSVKEVILNVLLRSNIATKASSVKTVCSIGLNAEEYKIRSKTLKYIQHVAKYNYEALLSDDNGSETNSETFHLNITSLIRSNLHTEGWPRIQIGQGTPNIHLSIEQRRTEYETLGELLQHTKLEDLSYIEFLIQSLLKDLPDFRTTIQNVLTGLAVNLSQNLKEEQKTQLKKIMKQYLNDDTEYLQMNKEEKDSFMSLRFVCLRFCNTIYSFDDSEARLLNVFGFSKKNRFDVMEEAMKGLNPYWYKMNKTLSNKSFQDSLSVSTEEIKFPDFQSFVQLLLSEAKICLTYNNHALRESLLAGIRFALRTAISQAVFQKRTIIQQDQDWSLRVEQCLSVDFVVEKLFKDFILSYKSQWYVDFLKLLLTEFCTSNNNEHILVTSNVVMGDILHTFIKYSKAEVLMQLGCFQQNLCFFIGNQTNQPHDLDNAVEIFGMISCQLGVQNPVTQVLLEKIKTSISERDFAPIIKAACSVVARFVAKGEGNTFSIQINNLYDIIEAKLKTGKAVYRNDALKCLSLLSKYGCFDYLTDKSAYSNTLNILATNIMNDEAALMAFSNMLIECKDDIEGPFEKVIIPTHQSKNVDFLFTVGEYLTVIMGKWESEFLARQLDVSGVELSILKSKYSRSIKFGAVLNRILHLSKTTTSPSMTKALCIWLLSIVQYCGSFEEVKNSVNEIHGVFMRFLSGRDEIIQEVASRGLSITFELGNADFKEDMVKQFFRSFTNSAASLGNNNNVGSDTELFDKGDLNTGDGSVSTYKDVMSLATEVGDPSLVYKFMSMAKSSSLWSSKKGLAFGLTAIVSKTSLSNMLLQNGDLAKKLIPKLFRYRFDPNEQVSASMNHMWKVLVPNSSEIVEEYFDLIIEELLTSIGDREWRVREASAAALRDLLQLFPQSKYEQNLERIWTMAFRTMDDIKDSVRQEGLRLTRVISNILVKSIDKNKGSAESKKVLDILVPFLMGPKGLNSDAEEVRDFSLQTVITLVKDCNPQAIQKYIPSLIEDLCLLLSSLEPQMINYVALNADKYDINMNLLDAKRAHQANESPIMDTIEKLIEMVEPASYEQLFDAVVTTVRKAVGLPSKVGAAKLIKLCCTKAPVEISPSSGKFLKVCLNNLKNSNNEMITSAYAVAFGYLFKNAPLSKMIKYSEKLVALYFEPSSSSAVDLNNKLASGVAIQAIVNYSPSQFEQVKGIFIPFVFVSRNFAQSSLRGDETDQVSKTTRRINGVFQHIWTESTSNSEADTIQYYLDEIIKINAQHIKSNDFKVRVMCLKSLADLVNKIKVSQTKENNISQIFDILTRGIEGRVWDGKEIVISTLIQTCIKFETYYKTHDNVKQVTETVLSVELLKKTRKYAYSVVNSFCDYCVNFPSDWATDLLIRSSIPLGLVEKKGEHFQNGGGSLDADGDAVMSDINLKSSQKNIDKETERNKLLENLSRACCWYSVTNPATGELGKRKFSSKLFGFIISNVFYAMTLKNPIVYTWRTELMSCTVGTILVNNVFSTSHSNDNDEQSNEENLETSKMFEDYWKLLYQSIMVDMRNKSIENVQIQLVRLGGLLLQKYPHLEQTIHVVVKDNLSLLLKADSTSSVVKNELKLAGVV